VPHFYIQVLFGRVSAIGFDAILKALANSPKSEAYRIAKVARNQFKSTIYIPLDKGVCLSTAFTQPTELKASIKQLPKGRVVVIVEFSGGEIKLNEPNLAQLIGLPAPAAPQ
jgi:AccI restriction endonuclease